MQPFFRGLKLLLPTLYPGYFAAVMATGIVSTAVLLGGSPTLSDILLWVGIALYLALVIAYVLRAVLARADIVRDLTAPTTMFTFFTITAGSDVLAARLALGGASLAPLVLGALGLGSWLILMYFVLLSLTLSDRPADLAAVNGGWLVAIVATESLAALASVGVRFLGPGAILVGYGFWSVGVLLYVVFIVLIVARLFFRRVAPDDLTPPYWINMGATAITTLAGARIALAAVHSPFLTTTLPFIEGLTVAIWAWGGWWIPFLVLVGLWKVVVRREPVAYHPSQWSIVFPLGMYATATWTLSTLAGLGTLVWIARPFIWIALGAWVLVGGLWIRGATSWWRRQGFAPATSPRLTNS